MILLHHPYVCICEEGECVIVTTLIIWSHKSDNNSATEVIMGNNSKQDRNPCIHSSILLGFRTGLKKHQNSFETPHFILCHNVLLFSFVAGVDDGNVIVSSC